MYGGVGDFNRAGGKNDDQERGRQIGDLVVHRSSAFGGKIDRGAGSRRDDRRLRCGGEEEDRLVRTEYISSCGGQHNRLQRTWIRTPGSPPEEGRGINARRGGIGTRDRRK